MRGTKADDIKIPAHTVVARNQSDEWRNKMLDRAGFNRLIDFKVDHFEDAKEMLSKSVDELLGFASRRPDIFGLAMRIANVAEISLEDVEEDLACSEHPKHLQASDRLIEVAACCGFELVLFQAARLKMASDRP